MLTRDLLAAVEAHRPTTKEWFSTARNYALYSNQGGIYDDILSWLKINEALAKMKIESSLERGRLLAAQGRWTWPKRNCAWRWGKILTLPSAHGLLSMALLSLKRRRRPW